MAVLENCKESLEGLPLVSVCLLTYQHAKYIEDSMKGVLNQTYPNLELIVLDDASTDGTAEIVEGFREKLEKRNISFLFIRHTVNGGNVPANCNEMIRKSHGKYIKMYGGDDVMLDGCIFSLVRFLEDSGCSIAYGNAYIIDGKYRYGEHYSREKFLKNHHEIPKERIFKRLLYGNPIPSPTAMVKKEAYERYGYYDENVGYEDYDLWLKFAAGRERFAYLDQPLYLYRKHDDGLSNCNSRTKFLFLYNQTVRIMKKYMKKISSQEREEIIIHFYKNWMKRAKQEHYMDICLGIKYKFVCWIMKNKFHSKRFRKMVLK